MENKCECCECNTERVVADIISTMIRNGDIDQDDSTFERRLGHAKDAVELIFKDE